MRRSTPKKSAVRKIPPALKAERTLSATTVRRARGAGLVVRGADAHLGIGDLGTLVDALERHEGGLDGARRGAGLEQVGEAYEALRLGRAQEIERGGAGGVRPVVERRVHELQRLLPFFCRKVYHVAGKYTKSRRMQGQNCPF